MRLINSTENQLLKNRQLLQLAAAVAVYILFITFTGIGCPILFLTGISCAGCGMTRALISACMLDFPSAFSFHPLFWLVPLYVILYIKNPVMLRKHKRAFTGSIIFLFLLVYVIRLLDPADTIVTADISKGLIYRCLSLLCHDYL